ncbi:DUF2189 domain-containing protein [Nocardia bovistercoris]|uniref:Integral membrane protein n=1 Tax=Nocardia bovistercoris TaxID=2785916 RepID=A0A931I6T5_9NOCA|nr:hypothetical protein [Nocardia bovistercoris]MBH0774930.1 hypothetical protein [Nocardia bovistercoris]
MTDTPSPVPRDPARDTPPRGEGAQPTGPGGQYPGTGQHPSGGHHQSSGQAAPPPARGAGHPRHEMPGGAGYPQFEGPGAAQYGTEPVEPPPAMTGSAQPSYGPTGTGPGASGSGDQPVYGYQVAGPTGLNVSGAIGYGLEKFRSNPAPWLGVTALGLVIYLVFIFLVQFLEPSSLLPVVVIFLFVLAALWVLQAAMVRGALYETDGDRPSFGSYFRYLNAGNVLLTALLVYLGVWIGLALCILPGLVVGYLCMFALHFVIDQDQGPFSAIRSSATAVLRNPGQTLLLALTVVVITLLGALLCGLGLLVAGPIAVIAVTYGYRTLAGGPVAP